MDVTNRTAMALSTTQPWRLDFTISPNVQANAKGSMRSSHRIRTLVTPLGFSIGWPKLALK
jgi:hypothetical protein